ncbi:hypothetical protein [Rhodovibrio salinarum]|uniref:Uncharacterized protein n=1 Tax=Rhodovibrio salinarum TaxID=1087 RepID=A0A934V0H9_9PROT|nr:hypothetical protein [Rhodovibrio salinarum]MBK1697646.1 hypothetical protein [Rhodovibrio salinarum]
MRYLFAALVAASLLTASAVAAGEADVLDAEIIKSGADRYRVSVTVRHADEGWDHYADQWRVLAPDGTVLGTRTLHHPHENEQPFTRSLGGVEIPPRITEVTIEARDSVHGRGGKTVTVAVPR